MIFRVWWGIRSSAPPYSLLRQVDEQRSITDVYLILPIALLRDQFHFLLHSVLEMSSNNFGYHPCTRATHMADARSTTMVLYLVGSARCLHEGLARAFYDKSVDL